MSASSSPPCVYCGAPSTTKDHVPPKCLFPKPRPNNLVTVPCCSSCNSQASLDDQYFKIMMASRREAQEHPASAALLATLRERFANPKSRGLVTMILNGLHRAEVRSSAGLVIDQGIAYEVDKSRLDAVASRTTKGLFYYERGYSLPSSHAVSSFTDPDLGRVEEDVMLNVAKVIAATEPKVLGGGIFSYRVHFLPSDPDSSFWFYRFFEAIPIISMTLRKESLTGAAGRR